MYQSRIGPHPPQRVKDVLICGRKMPLHDSRLELLKKQELYMRLLTDEEIKSMPEDDIKSFMRTIHYKPAADASLSSLQEALSTPQHTRTI